MLDLNIFLMIGYRLGVESAPAVVFLKDPGVKPLVYYGMLFCLT
jgi:hypothetical protein